MRWLLTMLLLLNYLLVVCASVAERAAQPVARPFDYAHSTDCQVKNAWRGGTCFEDCNGIQFRYQKGHKPLPLQLLLTSLKGVDLHCLPPVARVQRVAYAGSAGQWLAGRATRVLPGVPGQIYQPPRRG